LPSFKDWLGYNMTYNKVPSGNGNALHLHNSVEIFVALDGPFEIGYGTHGEHAAVLQPMDFVACPARVYHYYKNVEPSQPAQILTILPGKPTITWAPSVVEKARQNGAQCDDTGVLAMNRPSMKMDAPQVGEKVFLDGDISPFVMKHADKNALYLSSDEGWIQVGWKDLQCGQSVEVAGTLPAGPVTSVIACNGWHSEPTSPLKKPVTSVSAEVAHDVLLVVLQGCVEVTGPFLTESLGKLDMFKLPQRDWHGVVTSTRDTTLLIVRSELPHTFDFFFDPECGISTPLGRLPSSLMR
jgi:hypothetical protein